MRARITFKSISRKDDDITRVIPEKERIPSTLSKICSDTPREGTHYITVTAYSSISKFKFKYFIASYTRQSVHRGCCNNVSHAHTHGNLSKHNTFEWQIHKLNTHHCLWNREGVPILNECWMIVNIMNEKFMWFAALMANCGNYNTVVWETPQQTTRMVLDDCQCYYTVLVANCGISNKVVKEMPQHTISPVIYSLFSQHVYIVMIIRYI